MTHIGEDRAHDDAAAELPGERRAAALLDSLASTSCSAKIFRGKWAVIRGRLAGLASSLDSASPAGNTGTASSSIGNLVLQELLDEIAATVGEAHALACACDGGPDSPPGGKLLLRSNLDLTIAKLDLHARSLAGLFSSGILAHPASRVTPTKPVRGAAREELRSYVRSLLSELRLGTSENKSRALSALTEAIQEDERYLGLLAADETEAVLGLLPSFLESRDVALQRAAAETVSAIAASDSHRAALARAGVISPLVQVLQSGSPMGKESAARALRKLTERSICAWSVAAAGGVITLLDICGGVDPAVASELVVSACIVLRSLTGVAEIRSYMVEQGAVDVMLKRVRSAGGSAEGEGEEPALIQAMELLHTIFSVTVEARAMALRAGGLEVLVRVMDPGSGFSSKARDVALRAGEALCLPPPPSQGRPPKAALAGSGLVDRVMLFLRSGEITVQGNRKKHERDVAGEDEEVGRILRVLDRGDEKPLSRKFLLSALASLTESGSVAGKRKIAAAATPAIGYSGDLADTASIGSNDGVRIVRRSFAANRFKSLLHGVWS